MARASGRRVPPGTRWAFVVAVAGGILLASVAPLPDGGTGPAGPLGLVGLDAWFHAMGYASLAAALLWALAPTGRSARLTVLLAVGLAAGFGLAVEVLQVPLPTRHFEPADLVANGAGATATAAVWWVTGRLRRSRTTPARP